MSRIEEAIEQFGAALERLEAGINERNPGAVPAPALSTEMRAQMDKLKAERGLLQEELEILRSENDRLAGLAGDVTRQLDTAIEDMRTVLKRAS